jgi:hypothetical protein
VEEEENGMGWRDEEGSRAVMDSTYKQARKVDEPWIDDSNKVKGF